MTTAIKAGTLRSSSCAISTYIRAACFHSTPVLDRKRRTFWGSGQGGGGASKKSSKRPYNYSRRFRKMHDKETLLRNVGAYAECLFQSWQGDDDYSEPSSSKSSSWFKRPNWTNEPKRNSSASQGPQWETFRSRGGVFHFCDDGDEEVETIFRAAFGARFTYSDFFSEDHWRSSSGYSKTRKSSWTWKSRLGDEYDSYEQFNDSSDSSDSDLASNRLALGLSASGPLKLEDVKSAYRACALKWHPDRHQGSSKTVAEEKFKLCSAAYESLCEKLD